MKCSYLRNTRIGLAGGVALLALMTGAAYAQSQDVESITVSSTRLQAAGFNAPTPTTVLGADMLEAINKPNIFDAVNQMPALMNSNTTATGTHGTSGGNNGLDSFNMFGLGSQRTLTLMDGQRFVSANQGGPPDIGGWPHLLIQRVDVVTGGASASWGSDALAGVVNFITDKKFVGFKGEFTGGISHYADNFTAHAAFAAGTSFAGGRGHVQISAEYDHSDGLPGGQQGYYDLYGGRTWYKAQRMLQYASPAATPAGQPQYFASYNVQDNQRGAYGLINSGPLQGTAFTQNGSPYQFVYGTGSTGVKGVPVKTGTAGAAAAVTNCIAAFCIGGELKNDIGNGIGLTQARTRGSFYTRIGFDVTDNTNVWTTFTMSDVGTQAVSFPSSAFNALAGIATNTNGQVAQMAGIQCGLGPTAATLTALGGSNLSGPNGFLPDSINQACITSNARSFGFGSVMAGQTPSQWVKTQRITWRTAFGIDGTFNAFDSDWNWSSYFTHGEVRTNNRLGPGLTLQPYFFAAIDAVKATANDGSGATPGAVVCRNATARAMGCIPINLFGGTPLDRDQLHWITGGDNWDGKHRQLQILAQNVASISITGSPLELWAGKLAVAAGLEYREEMMDLRADGAAAGNKPGSFGAPAATCVDPLLNCIDGNNWYGGNFKNGHGNYHVSEGFVEFGVPLIDSPSLGHADLDLAARYEMYAPAGTFMTWKVGLNWDTPIQGLRLRTLMSRDVHTPTLDDLFAPQTTARALPTNPWTGGTVNTLQQNGGNPGLKPERSVNTQLGFVYQPDWIPGFQFSMDYYRLAIADAIGAVDYQTSINQCFAGLTEYCSAIVTASGQAPGLDTNWTLIKNQAFNVASTVTDGFSYQASYNTNLEDMGLAGDLNLRALANNVSKFISTPGLPGTVPIQSAGNNDLNDLNRNNTSIPHWVIQLYQTYTFSEDSVLKGTTITLAERWISEGKKDNNAIQCGPGTCPASTLAKPTINDNHVPGIYYVNLGVTHQVTDSMTAFVQIDNLLNKDPPPDYYNNYNTRPFNWNLYDGVGRMFNVGIRIRN